MSDKAVRQILDRVAGGDARGTCECCNAEPMKVMASVPGVPMSIAWGEKCLNAHIVPLWVAFAQATPADDGGPRRNVDRGMFDEWWLDWHDRTLAHFGVTDSEFWDAINE